MLNKLLLLTALVAVSQASLLSQVAAARTADTVVTARVSASASGLNLLLLGSAGPNEIRISLSADGRSYLITSSSALEVGGQVCANPVGNPDQLICQAPLIAGFEFNGGPGNDVVIVGSSVMVPATLRGGPGNDRLIGGGGTTNCSAGQAMTR